LNGEKPEIKTISNIFLELMDGRNIWFYGVILWSPTVKAYFWIWMKWFHIRVKSFRWKMEDVPINDRFFGRT
jgi:hypothetical protein